MPPKKSFPLGRLLFLLFIVVPLCELVILVMLTKLTSIWFTLGVVLLTALTGATLLRAAGLGVWLQAQREMAMGRFPADQLIDGILLLMGGAMLLTPGLLTDCLGALTLIPATRAILRGLLKAWFIMRLADGTIRVQTVGGFPPPPPNGAPSAQQTPGEVEGDPSAGSQWPGEKTTPFDR
jgi:UPF0716 protein FxsA